MHGIDAVQLATDVSPLTVPTPAPPMIHHDPTSEVPPPMKRPLPTASRFRVHYAPPAKQEDGVKAIDARKTFHSYDIPTTSIAFIGKTLSSIKIIASLQ